MSAEPDGNNDQACVEYVTQSCINRSFYNHFMQRKKRKCKVFQKIKWFEIFLPAAYYYLIEKKGNSENNPDNKDVKDNL